MEKLKTLLQWLDKHLLTILVIGFIFIIPLYPKLPFKMINYTYIAIRLEDFYMVFISLVYAIAFLRKKVRVPWIMFLMFVAYWAAVFGSYYNGYFVQETITINHLGFLHSLRRIEYMMIFFIAYTTIRSKRDFFTYLNLIFIVLFIVGIYGFGQRFIGWPAVQTMNPEYAKGRILVLDSWARVSSTFAGHYDLGGYLVLLSPLTLGFYAALNKKIYFGLFILALGALILTASRGSLLAYAIIVPPFLLLTRQFKLIIAVLIFTLIAIPLSGNLTDRIMHTFQKTQTFVNSETGKIIVPRIRRPDALPPGDFRANKNIDIPILSDEERTKSLENIDPVIINETKALLRESIVAENQSKSLMPSDDEINAIVEESFKAYVPVTISLLDISVSTRFQIVWPKAYQAFLSNIWLGSGPSSLGEATDGDYLRWLGETGIIGTGLFLSILGAIWWRIWRATQLMARKMQYIFYGFLFGFIGLFINAGYIDLFEASKLAYTFWLVAGVFYAAIPYMIRNAPVDKLKI